MGFPIRLSSGDFIARKFLHELFPVLISLMVITCGIILSLYFLNESEGAADTVKKSSAERFAASSMQEDWGQLAQYKPIVKEYAAHYGIEPALVRAVMLHESEGKARLVSSAGALGLMQCTPDKFAPGEDPFDPRTNIKKGTNYLARMLDKFNSVSLALAAYNAGPGAVLKYDGIPPYPETRAYVSQVMNTYKKFR